MPIETLLIANRGEIACRIARTCRDLGIRSVAVHSEADAEAAHVALCDEAVAIGPPPARQSYLNTEAVLEAARRTGANAVHPGYGFLSENRAFAEAVMAEGMVWVGPAPQTIEDMGDKDRARAIAAAAGVPILPGSRRFAPDDGEGLEEAADGVGYPLLVKAAAGGGGIGMRRVDRPEDLFAVVSATWSMAAKAFADGAVYLERFVPNARHVEVQVFGFGDGTGVHLHDRDCSVQRRFQKIIEEAPAPDLAPEARARMHRTAVDLVARQRYDGAGTVEFIYDADRGEAYFLEMNTRLQVEHPVTEMITGIDLVAWQIRHAEGRLPPVAQEDIAVSGHAMECRVYAERPEKNFLPSPGRIEALSWPEDGQGVRVDAGVLAGGTVTPYYDPMIGKVIAAGADRPQAMRRLAEALAATEVRGPSTNVAFLRAVLDSPGFSAGPVTTGFVQEFTSRKEPA